MGPAHPLFFLMLAFALLTGIASPAHSDGGNAALAFHTFGAINDPMSHGQVGDNLLSLNEAIQLHNQTLQYSQLSAAEQAQVLLIPGSGTQTFLSWARLDASITPVITIEQDLETIGNTNYGLFLSSDNGFTRFDFSGANITRGMLATTNSLQMRDIEFFGGPYGIDVVQTDIAGQIGFAINDCRFVSQSQFGVRIRSTTPSAFGKGYLERCEFEGMPTAMIWDGQANDRTAFFDLVDCRIGNVTTGIVHHLQDGGVGRYTLERVVIEAAVIGYELSHGGNTHTTILEWRHVEMRAPDCAAIDGQTGAATRLAIQMAHLWSTGVGGTALDLADHGHDVAGTIEDSTFDGEFSVRTGGGAMALTLHNVRCRNSVGEFATSPGQTLSVIDSRFDQCGTTIIGNGQVDFDNCCFPDGYLTGSGTGSAACSDSYLHPTVAGPQVSSTNPRPHEQLGGMRVLPDSPTVGSTVIFEADLPTGLFGVFLLGFTDAFPQFPWPQPLHVYSQIGNTFLLPGAFRFQQQHLWPIPNNALFIGLDLVAQIAVLPDPGVNAQPVQLAPGRRFALQ